MAAKAGWYPHPKVPGLLRYWDGQAWTEHTAPAASKPAAPRAGSGTAWPYRVAAIVIVTVSVGALWFVFGYSSPENKAVRACHDYVELRLKAPATAEFSDEFATEADDGTWTVYGNVDSENGFGAKVRNAFTCQVDGTAVRDSHFSQDD